MTSISQVAKATTSIMCLALAGCEAISLGLLPVAGVSLLQEVDGEVYRCRGAFVAGGILTAAHCVTGEAELPLDEVRNDWTILIDGRRGLELPVVPYSFRELRSAINSGATLEVAGQTPCQVTPPLGAGFFSSNCSVKHGDSGSPVLLHLPCATDYECEMGLPHSVLVGLVSGLLGTGPRGPAVIVSAEEFASTVNGQ